MTIRNAVLAFALVCAAAPPAAAYRNVEVGDTVGSFTLLDQWGKPVVSRDVMRDLTVFVAIDKPEDYAKRVLDDLAALAASYSPERVAIRVVIRSEIHDGVLLHIPNEMRYDVLFDPTHVLDSVLGLIVLPSTGVFASSGQLLAYIPLWRASYREELDLGIQKSLSAKGGGSLLSAWQPALKRQDILEAAETLEASGSADSAIALLSRAVRDDTVWLQAKLILGDLLAKRGRHAEAYRIYLEARDASNGNPHVFIGLAQSLIHLGHPDSALQYLSAGQSLAAQPELFLKLEGDVYESQAKTDSALVRWRAAVESLLGISHDGY